MKRSVKLTISDLSVEGEGIGKKDKEVYFIEDALPGEAIEAEIVEVKRRLRFGKVHYRTLSSPDRITPLCPLFGRCGGCQLQHLSYEGQLKWKKTRIQETLKRIGGIEKVEVAEVIPSSNPFFYRNKLQLPVRQGQVGFFSKRSHQHVPIENCLVHLPLGEEVLKVIQDVPLPSGIDYVLIRSSFTTKEALLTVMGQKSGQEVEFAHAIAAKAPSLQGVLFSEREAASNRIVQGKMELLYGREWIYEEVLGLKVALSATAFFQINPFQTPLLYRLAIERLQIEKTSHVYDAYAGIGVLTLLAAQKGEFAHGTEVVRGAVEDAKRNARENHISNVSFSVGLAEEEIQQRRGIDRLLLNPPRKGCDLKLIETILQHPVERIVYISCDPATLARDLNRLKAKYEILSIEPFDLFPQTTHVETVVTLRLI